MIDICAWRASIGRFPFSKRTVRPQHKKWIQYVSVHENQASVYDILLTFVSLLFLARITVVAIHTAVTVYVCNSNQSSEFLTLSFGKFTADLSNEGERSKQNDLVTFDLLTRIVPAIPPLTYCLFCSRLLCLSHDVEENPGPTSKDSKRVSMTDKSADFESTILEKITSMEKNMQDQNSQVLTAVENQSKTLKQFADSLKEIEENQRTIHDSLTKLSQEITEMKRDIHDNKEAVDNVASRQDETEFHLTTLESEIDRLESFSRRNNVKFFGIAESSNEDEEKSASAVKQILSKYLPHHTWQDDTIDRAHRLGKRYSDDPRPRPIIARFQRWSDLMTVMRNRQARQHMNQDGVRVSQDLTKRQTAKLRELRSEGKSGYFINGQLRIRSETDNRRSSFRSAPTYAAAAAQDNRSPIRPTTQSNARDHASSRTDDDTPPRTVHTSPRDKTPEEDSHRPRTRSATSGTDTATDARRQSTLRETWGRKSPPAKSATNNRK